MKRVSNTIVMTLFGQQLAEKYCETCNTMKYRCEFYARTENDNPRGQCIECWSLYKGANPNKPKVEEKNSNTLEFILGDL